MDEIIEEADDLIRRLKNKHWKHGGCEAVDRIDEAVAVPLPAVAKLERIERRLEDGYSDTK